MLYRNKTSLQDGVEIGMGYGCLSSVSGLIPIKLFPSLMRFE